MLPRPTSSSREQAEEPTATATACAACSRTQFYTFFDFGEVPRSGTFLRYANSPFATVSLRFEFCHECGLIRQQRGSAAQPDYSEIGRRTARQLPDYAGEIVRRLVAAVPTPDADLVVEVGANDGTFLDLLRGAGFENRLAIEPSRPLARICRDAGHEVENIHLTEADAPRITGRYGAARAVVCRHTLEHVPDPYALLCAMRRLLADGGCLFLEVPATAPIVDRLFAHELWDEHLTYFSPGNLERMASLAGFRVIDGQVAAHRSSENLMLWARASEATTVARATLAAAAHELLASCATFHARWTAFSAHMRRLATTWRAPVYALGASHPQSNFLLFSGLGASITGLVDEDPSKIGCHVPLPQPTPVLSARMFLETMRRGTLLLTAFGYPAWMQQVRAELASSPVAFVDPLEHLRQS